MCIWYNGAQDDGETEPQSGIEKRVKTVPIGTAL